MTIYIHGRPLREVRARRRRAAALVLVVLGVTVWLATGGGGRRAGAAAATGLDPQLQHRFDEAAQSARAQGIHLTITSGWRSAADQQTVLDQAVARYGATEARRWALPPDRSAHVRGEAIDVGDTAGARWLTAHGATFGLCRVYANEVWHFEPTVGPGGTCPALRPDSSGDW